MGLLNEDDEPIAVVPIYDHRPGRNCWQPQLSPKMQVFMKQITLLRQNRDRWREGDKCDILIKQG